jgi:hypothetical protein
MEPQQERGFWSQLTTVSKVLIFLIVLGVLAGSAWYIFKGEEDAAATGAAPFADSIASDNTSNTIMTDSVAVDSKMPSQPEKVETAVDEVPVKARTSEARAAAVKKLKAKSSTKKSTAAKSESTPAKPKKKTKNNEDVEVDI